MPAPAKPQFHFPFYFLLVAVLLSFGFQDVIGTIGNRPETIPYSQFQTLLATGKLDKSDRRARPYQRHESRMPGKASRTGS